MNTAVRRGLLERNPAATVELPRRARPGLEVWSADQFAGFMNAIVEEPLYPLYLLLGCSVSVVARSADSAGTTSTSSRAAYTYVSSLSSYAATRC